jgi:hypothetical protein
MGWLAGVAGAGARGAVFAREVVAVSEAGDVAKQPGAGGASDTNQCLATRCRSGSPAGHLLHRQLSSFVTDRDSDRSPRIGDAGPGRDRPSLPRTL